MAPVADTSIEAAHVQAMVFRDMSGEQRLLRAFEMSDMVVLVTEEGIRHRNPGYSDDEVHLASLRLRLGDGVFRSALPDAPLMAP